MSLESACTAVKTVVGPPIIVTDKPTTTTTTTTTTSMSHGTTTVDDAFSTVSRSTNRSSSDNLYEVIEYDLADTDHSQNSNAFNLFPSMKILEDSPAAEALRANASVRVSKAGKAARAVHMQTVRRGLKYIAGKHQHGVRKGKPPRVPPSIFAADEDERSNSIIEEEESDFASEIDDAEHERHEGDEYEEKEEHDDEEEKHHDEHFQDENESSQSESGFEVEPIPTIPETPKHTRQPQHVDELNHMPENVAPGTIEAGKKVLGSMDPHDLLKLVRWRRKKKGSDRHQKKSYVKGKVIDGEHELYTLSIAVMIGVRTSISRTNTLIANQHRWVRPMDFKTAEKYEFRPKGDGPLPPHQLAHTFKFKDYSPVVFAYLRRNFGVNEFDFLLSVCGNANFIEFISNAKSGQFFFYSYDGRYMIKTMTNAESKFLRQILPQYFKHCCENPNTLITRFYGMYRVKLYHLRRNVKFVIMNSVYYTDKHLQTFYDLKGSVFGRDAKPGQAVLKDNDLRKNLPQDAIILPEQQRSRLRKQIETDCAFLKSMGIMDYSMLVGVHHVPLDDTKAVGPPLGSRGKNRPHRARIYSENSVSGRSEVDGSESNAMTDAPKSPSSRQSEPVLSHHPSPHRKIPNDNSMRLNSHGRTGSDASALAAHLFEDGLEDDDNSYLAGSEKHPCPTLSFNEETERKKQVTIEKLFWPFHHLYDIHGYRRVKPVPCLTCKAGECTCVADATDVKILQGYRIPQFVPPLSHRKDGGLEMDVSGFQLPLKWKSPTNGVQQCEGKIFFMGIIDILQEYNSRKALESRYRRFQSVGRMAPSCVPPDEYGRRFLSFFDEYTQPETAEGAKRDA